MLQGTEEVVARAKVVVPEQRPEDIIQPMSMMMSSPEKEDENKPRKNCDKKPSVLCDIIKKNTTKVKDDVKKGGSMMKEKVNPEDEKKTVEKGEAVHESREKVEK